MRRQESLADAVLQQLQFLEYAVEVVRQSRQRTRHPHLVHQRLTSVDSTPALAHKPPVKTKRAPSADSRVAFGRWFCREQAAMRRATPRSAVGVCFIPTFVSHA